MLVCFALYLNRINCPWSMFFLRLYCFKLNVLSRITAILERKHAKVKLFILIFSVQKLRCFCFVFLKLRRLMVIHFDVRAKYILLSICLKAVNYTKIRHFIIKTCFKSWLEIKLFYFYTICFFLYSTCNRQEIFFVVFYLQHQKTMVCCKKWLCKTQWVDSAKLKTVLAVKAFHSWYRNT